jgi:hypothetical protein
MAKVQLHELRKLVLPLDTALDAVLELDCEQGGPLAFGVIVSAQIESDPDPGLLVVVQRRGTDTTDTRKFELPILAAAIIRYCWKCRIPLPRAGAKRIEVGPEGFIFTIEGTIEVVRRHGALPRRDPPREAVRAVPESQAVPESVAEAAPEAEAAQERAPMPSPMPVPEEIPERMASAS